MRGILALLAAGAGGYVLVARGALTLDLGVGRRSRPLGPIERAMEGKLQVWERGSDMALAAHMTTTGRLTTTTVESVRFERPHRISFRLLRGPVPHVVESYELRAVAAGTGFTYRGELGTDLWALG